jgi:ribosome biogenesis protein NSA1
MRVLTGDECGLIKEFLPATSGKKNKQTVAEGGGVITSDGITRVNVHATMARETATVDMTWMAEYQHFAALDKEGSVQVWEGNFTDKSKSCVYQQVTEIPRVFSHSDDNTAPPNALGLHAVENRLCACDSAGNVSILDAFAEENNVVKEFKAFEASKDQTVLITAHAATSTTLALGGKDRETVLYDLNTQNVVWKAKNLPPDPQTLLSPRVWPTAAHFMLGNSNNALAVGTAYHQVRIYDLRTSSGSASATTSHQLKPQRRPISYTPHEDSFLEHRITALCSIDEHQLVIGDAAGYIHAVDIRKLSGGALLRQSTTPAVLGRFVGPAGSVRQIACRNNKMACVGLDRMLRIYSVNTRRLLTTVYLKQRLNCLLLTDETDDDDTEDEEDDDSNEEQDDKVEDYVDSDFENDSSDLEENDDIRIIKQVLPKTTTTHLRRHR